jgi:hypothetical protein
MSAQPIVVLQAETSTGSWQVEPPSGSWSAVAVEQPRK